MRSAYSPETAIQHPKFGLGFVVGVTPQAIQVVFEDGERSLVYNPVVEERRLGGEISHHEFMARAQPDQHRRF